MENKKYGLNEKPVIFNNKFYEAFFKNNLGFKDDLNEMGCNNRSGNKVFSQTGVIFVLIT